MKYYDFIIQETKDEMDGVVQKKWIRIEMGKNQDCGRDGCLAVSYKVSESVCCDWEDDEYETETERQWLLFDSGLDEGSVLYGGRLSKEILDLAVHSENAEKRLCASGNGVEWDVRKKLPGEDASPASPWFEFRLFSPDGTGYRFFLSQTDAIRFANFLEQSMADMGNAA